MDAIDNKTVITDDRINKYVRRYKNDDRFKQSLIEIMHMFCKNYENILVNHKRDTEEGNMICYMREMEKRLEDRSSKLGDVINVTKSELIQEIKCSSKVIDVVTGHYNILRSEMLGLESRIKDSLSEKVRAMIMNINEMVSASLGRLNMESLSNTFGVQFDSMRSDIRFVVEESIERYQGQVKDEVEKATKAIMQQNTDILDEIRDIVDKGDMEVYDEVIKNTTKVVNVLSDKVSKAEKDIHDNVVKALSRIRENKEVSSTQHTSLVSEMKSIPMLVKGTLSKSMNKLERLDQIEQDVKIILQEYPLMKVIKSEIDKMMSRVEEMSKQLLSKAVKEENNSSLKGHEGERRLLEGLSEHLLCRDGYRVENVSGQAHECDLVIRREGHRTIRIESKVYKEKVRTSEVDKFCRDLQECEDHGIFVSLHSGVVGRCNNEIQQLSTGRFAVYLSNNNYNIEQIVSMIYMIYRLDEIIDKYKVEEDEDGFIVSPECLQIIKEKIDDHNNHITQVINKMKEGIMMVNKLDISWLEPILLGNTNKDNKSKVQGRRQCQYCGNSLSIKSISRHEKNCKMRNTTIQ